MHKLLEWLLSKETNSVITKLFILVFLLIIWFSTALFVQYSLLSHQDQVPLVSTALDHPEVPNTTFSTGSVVLTGTLSSTRQNISSSGVVLTGASQTGILNATGSVVSDSDWDKDDICILDICIRVKKPYFSVWDTYVQLYYLTWSNSERVYLSELPEKNEDGSYSMMSSPFTQIKINKDSLSGSVSDEGEMFRTDTMVTKISKEVYFVKEKSGGCWWTGLKQKFMRKDKSPASFDELQKEYPTTFQVGATSFQSYWTEDSVYYGFRHSGLTGPSEIKDIFSIHDNIGSKLLGLIKSRREFSHSYAIRYREYPGMVFLYKSNLSDAERVIFLWNDEKWKKENLDGEWNIKDIDLTKKILWYYEPKDNTGALILGKQIQKKWDENYDRITTKDLTGSLMPVFRVVPLDSSGDYLLYPAKEYESVSMAELCKPVVYVYDTRSRDNNLTVTLPRGWAFTKIIPDFTSGTRWNFSADKNSSIQMHWDTSKYDYLYYSVSIPNYIYNQNGWQIYGRDIGRFFDEKLDSIWFNSKEKKDFIDYWITEFEANQLYFVSFKFDEKLDTYVNLAFSSKPISQMRVLLEAYPIENKENKAYLWPNVGTRFDAILLKKFVRSNQYDVFEWWGTVQRSSLGPIRVY